jgi:Rod binding domain-containing protein
MRLDAVSTQVADAATPRANAGHSLKLKEAGQQFEALLLAQMLRSAHSEGEGWFGTDEESPTSSAVGLAEEYFAQALSQGGGLGLTSYIENNLEPK